MTHPYRTPSRSPLPTRPWRCRIGWHAWRVNRVEPHALPAHEFIASLIIAMDRAKLNMACDRVHEGPGLTLLRCSRCDARSQRWESRWQCALDRIANNHIGLAVAWAVVCGLAVAAYIYMDVTR